jgi:hypothetical protein
MSGPVPDKVIPNLEHEQFDGRWHPSGFMVFPLAKHPDLGYLRLHIWPKGLRQRENRGRGILGNIWDGDPHNHAWHVTGYNIVGYRDVLYEVEPVEYPDRQSYEEVAANGLGHFRIFRAEYDEASGDDVLTTQGECVTVTPREERNLVNFPTDIHQIAVGDYHAPTVPENELAATLVFNSYRVKRDGPEILVGGAATVIVGARKQVTLDEKLFAKAQLLNALEGGVEAPSVPRRMGNLALVPDLPNTDAS